LERAAKRKGEEQIYENQTIQQTDTRLRRRHPAVILVGGLAGGGRNRAGVSAGSCKLASAKAHGR
jgi:hypothetical protein